MSVSSGYLHTCGLKTDGSVACWGDDSEGQSTPPDGSFVSVSAGWDHSCGSENKRLCRMLGFK